jgi:hypothetical protein
MAPFRRWRRPPPLPRSVTTQHAVVRDVHCADKSMSARTSSRVHLCRGMEARRSTTDRTGVDVCRLSVFSSGVRSPGDLFLRRSGAKVHVVGVA